MSAACDWCYAESWGRRTGKVPKWNGPRYRAAKSTWDAPFSWNRKAAKDGKRYRVFTLSLGDFFDNQVPEDWRTDAWDVVRECRNLDWLILTKRPQNMPGMMPADWGRRGWKHVWLGTTVENMAEAHRRIPHLVAVPARVHWLSCEPLLEPLNLRPWLANSRGHIRWVVVGGETGGPKNRPTDPEWMRDVLQQCRETRSKFFLKQMWRKKPIPRDLRVRQFPRIRHTSLHAPRDRQMSLPL